MFAYCGNNPVLHVDAHGYFFGTAIDILTLCSSFGQCLRNPYDPVNWVTLAADVVDVAVPLVSGCGEAVKLARAADAASDGLSCFSKAKDYGIKAYNALRKQLEGTGLQAHHIIEQRLVQFIDDIDVKTMLSVALTRTEHQRFTNAWRDWFEYGMSYADITVDDLWEAAQDIYSNYPALLEAARKILGK